MSNANNGQNKPAEGIPPPGTSHASPANSWFVECLFKLNGQRAGV